MPVEKGNKVKIEYTGTLEDGTVFDASEKHGHPLEFEAGAGQIIPGLDKEIIGMEPGQEKDVKVSVKEGYGPRNDELVKKFPKAQVPDAEKLKEGMMLMLGTQEGQQIPATITAIGETDVTIDLNHPLAGKDLNFKVKLLEIA